MSQRSTGLRTLGGVARVRPDSKAEAGAGGSECLPKSLLVPFALGLLALLVDLLARGGAQAVARLLHRAKAELLQPLHLAAEQLRLERQVVLAIGLLAVGATEEQTAGRAGPPARRGADAGVWRTARPDRGQCAGRVPCCLVLHFVETC